MEHDNDHNYGLRFAATDWDRETAESIREYFKTLPPDAEGNRPGVVLDETGTSALGIHIFPLDRYSKAQRDEILLECVKIRLAKALTMSVLGGD